MTIPTKNVTTINAFPFLCAQDKQLESKDAPVSAGGRLIASSVDVDEANKANSPDSDRRTTTGGRLRADSGCCEDVAKSEDEAEAEAEAEELDLEFEEALEQPDMPEPKLSEEPVPEDEELALDLDFIPDEVAEYARRELGETEEVKCQTVHELREMIYGEFAWFLTLFNLYGGLERQLEDERDLDLRLS